MCTGSERSYFKKYIGAQITRDPTSYALIITFVTFTYLRPPHTHTQTKDLGKKTKYNLNVLFKSEAAL